MKKTNLVQFVIAVPKEVKDQLKRMAAKRNMENVDQHTSASEIARNIICENLLPYDNSVSSTHL